MRYFMQKAFEIASFAFGKDENILEFEDVSYF